MKLGTETASMTNYLMSGTKGAPTPSPGMGATILMWTDRHAGTIIAVTPKSFTLREDTAIRTDSHGMSDAQAYRYEPNPHGRTWIFRLTKKGWRSKGTAVALGVRREYYDYSF